MKYIDVKASILLALLFVAVCSGFGFLFGLLIPWPLCLIPSILIGGVVGQRGAVLTSKIWFRPYKDDDTTTHRSR